MISSAKMKIIATVPVAMICEFMLLDAAFIQNKENNKTNVSQETLSYSNEEYGFSTIQTPKQDMPKFFKNKSKLKVLSFPKPAEHTFAGPENNQENFTLNGAIIK